MSAQGINIIYDTAKQAAQTDDPTNPAASVWWLHIFSSWHWALTSLFPALPLHSLKWIPPLLFISPRILKPDRQHRAEIAKVPYSARGIINIQVSDDIKRESGQGVWINNRNGPQGTSAVRSSSIQIPGSAGLTWDFHVSIIFNDDVQQWSDSSLPAVWIF